MAVVELNEDNFKYEVLENPGITIVDFWAEWCGPCRMQGPFFDQASEEAAGKAKFGKLNVDEAQKISAEYGVMSIPTLIVFKDGEKVNQVSGVQDKDTIVKMVSEIPQVVEEAGEEGKEEEPKEKGEEKESE